jgi:zinc transport system ATP-binding protein
MKLIEFKNISLKINNQEILSDISLQINRQEIVTIIGINGSGKTSLARIIIGSLKPTSGKITFAKNLKIGHLPQKINIDKTIPLDVLSFIKLINQNKLSADFYSWCDRLKITNILNHQIRDISGGQLQKVLFLQAIANHCDLLILDEPTQYMDLNAVNEFYKIIDEYRKQYNCGVLLISHDLHLVMQKTDMVYCINRHLCCFGKPEHINQHPEYLALLGENQQDKNNINQISFYTHHHDHQHN